MLLTLLFLFQTGVGPPNQYQPPPPHPLTISQTRTVPYTTGIYHVMDNRYHVAVTVDKFQPVGGQRLRGATLHFQSFTATDLMVENTDYVNSAMWQWSLQSHSAILSPLGTNLAQGDVIDPLRPWRLTKFDGIADGYGTSAHRETRVATSAPFSVQLTGPELDAFLGSGPVDLDLELWGLFTYSATTANGIGGIYRKVAASITLEYFIQ